MLSSSLRRSDHEEQHNVNESAEVPPNCCWNLLFAKDSQLERSLKEIGTLKDKELKKPVSDIILNLNHEKLHY